MDRNSQRILSLYRNHVQNRLEYAYGDGDIGDDDYDRIQHKIVGAQHFSGLWRAIADLRSASRAPGRHRWARPRWILTRRERQLRYERRWWKPERFWIVGLIIAFGIGAAVLFGLVLATEWISSFG